MYFYNYNNTNTPTLNTKKSIFKKLKTLLKYFFFTISSIFGVFLILFFLLLPAIPNPNSIVHLDVEYIVLGLLFIFQFCFLFKKCFKKENICLIICIILLFLNIYYILVFYFLNKLFQFQLFFIITCHFNIICICILFLKFKKNNKKILP